MATQDPQIYKLSPSDFAFLYKECKRCYYQKIRDGKYRPYQPMPSIFNTIDKAMKVAFEGGLDEQGQIREYEDRPFLNQIDPDLPHARVFESNLKVQSDAILFEDINVAVYVAGEMDTLLIYEDGSYGVGDGKSTAVKPEYVDLYSHQLHAYAFALSRPGAGKPKRTPVKHLGLLIFDPSLGFFPSGDAKATLHGHLKWLEVPIDSSKFKKFLKEIATLLSTEELPKSGARCSYCRYLSQNGIEIDFESEE